MVIIEKNKIRLDVFKLTANIVPSTTPIITKNPKILIQTSIANQLSIQNYYSSFSKNQEKEADLFAIDRLNILEISSKDLIKFLKFLETESFKRGVSKESFKFSTHPNYEERLNIISALKNVINSDWEHLDEFVKLGGFVNCNPDFITVV